MKSSVNLLLLLALFVSNCNKKNLDSATPIETTPYNRPTQVIVSSASMQPYKNTYDYTYNENGLLSKWTYYLDTNGTSSKEKIYEAEYVYNTSNQLSNITQRSIRNKYLIFQ